MNLKNAAITRWSKAKDDLWSFYLTAGPKKKLAILAFLSFSAINLLTVFWGMPNAFTWSVDDPSGISTIAFVKADGGNYAPFSYIIRLISYLPLLGVFFLFGAWDLGAIKYPSFGFSDPDWQLGSLLVFSRLVNFGLYLATGYLIHRLAARFDRRAAWWAFLLYMLSPLVVEFSTYGNVDTPTMFLTAWALFHLSEVLFSRAGDLRSRSWNWSWFFVALAGVVGFKESMALALILPFSFVFLRCGYLSRSGWKSLASEFFPGVIWFFIIFIVSNNLVFDWSGYRNHFTRLVSHDSATNAVFPMFSPWELFKRIVESVALVAPLSLLFLPAAWRSLLRKDHRVYSWFLIALPLSSFIFFVCRFGRTYLRHNIPIVFIASIFAGLAIWQISSHLKGRWRLAFQASVVSILFSLALIPVWGKFNDSRYEAEKFILSIVSDKDVQVLSNRYHVYLPRMHKLVRDRRWNAKSIIFNSKITRQPDKDLYIVEYAKFDFYREALLRDYGVIYDSGARYPYYHAWDVRLSPCRISCRVLVLEKKSLGGVDSVKIEADIKSFYDEELKHPNIYYAPGEKESSDNY